MPEHKADTKRESKQTLAESTALGFAVYQKGTKPIMEDNRPKVNRRRGYFLKMHKFFCVVPLEKRGLGFMRSVHG